MPNVLPLNVGGVRALKTRLDTDLAAVIAQVNAEAGVEVQLDTTYTVFDFVPAVANIIQWPTLGIAEGEVNFEDDTGWSATGRFDLAIVIFMRDPDRYQLAWKLRHMARAVATCVLKNRDMGQGWGMTLQGIEPGPLLRARESVADGELIGIRAVTINYRDEQDA